MTLPLSLTRRGFIAGAAATATAAALPRPVSAATTPWTRESYLAAMEASGRQSRISQAQFDAIQRRKPIALKRIEKYLVERLGSADPAVMAAFEENAHDSSRSGGK